MDDCISTDPFSGGMNNRVLRFDGVVVLILLCSRMGETRLLRLDIFVKVAEDESNYRGQSPRDQRSSLVAIRMSIQVSYFLMEVVSHPGATGGI